MLLHVAAAPVCHRALEQGCRLPMGDHGPEGGREYGVARRKRHNPSNSAQGSIRSPCPIQTLGQRWVPRATAQIRRHRGSTPSSSTCPENLTKGDPDAKIRQPASETMYYIIKHTNCSSPEPFDEKKWPPSLK